MSSPTSPGQGRRSILDQINPYVTSPTRADRQGHDSPSALLLRELQGDERNEHADAADGEVQSSRHTPRPRDAHDMNPTPTRSRPIYSLESSSSSEDEGPPKSIMFGEPAGDVTPRSPERSGQRVGGRTTKPTFRQVDAPSSSSGGGGNDGVGGRVRGISKSTSRSRSTSRTRSPSPGPSSISAYASGLEGTVADSVRPSEIGHASPGAGEGSTVPRTVPTFREPPGMTGHPSTARSTRPSPRQELRQAQSGRGRAEPAYLDPPSMDSTTRKGKGKAKAKQSGGRQYHALAVNEDDQDLLDGPHDEQQPVRKIGMNEYEKALWKWVNVEDLDGFLQEVYEYYKGKGLWCILLARFLNLITTFFVVGFSTFLGSCIDYSKLNAGLSGPHDVERLDDVLIPQCITRGSFPHTIFIICVGLVYIFQLVTFATSIPRLLDIYQFYTHLLGIPDADIQTLPWPEIVRLIGEIRKHNPITSLSNDQAEALADMVGGEDTTMQQVKKLDAHDVANRILRQENYLIALFNKELLDLRVRLPIPHQLENLIPPRFIAPPVLAGLPSANGGDSGEKRKFFTFGENGLTKALEWNLRFCLMGYLFDRRGQVRREFVREKGRKDLVEGLKTRFIFMGILNAMFAPFIVVYLLIYSFFRYFEEYHKNPSSIGSRSYTPYAQWKFREFNELPHLFERRLDMSYPIAKEYIDQFPKERTALVMRFVAFIAGSFAAVLLAASLIDPDLFLHFEITPHRTVLFYLGIFGSILAIARGMVPEENLVFDPEASLREVVRWTHYLPGEWKGKLHSQMVHAEFSRLFAMKIGIFFTEILSVLLTPFILLFSLPPCAGAIIDFFREFTVHVDGIGYVCSFAVFDFTRHGNVGGKAAGGVADQADATDTQPRSALSPIGPVLATQGKAKTAAYERLRANENKMEKSFLHFKATHPDWVPDPSSSVFLDKLVGLHRDTLANPAPGNMSASMYAGGRGLGLGPAPAHHLGAYGASSGYFGQAALSSPPMTDDSVIRERSQSYDRAWAKSSHLLRRSPARSAAAAKEGSARLAGVQEDAAWEVPSADTKPVERSLDDATRMGYYAGAKANGADQRLARSVEEDEEDGGGFLRDAGVVGLLQQIMKR